MSGICKAKNSPFAIETPILKPEYEPGPEEIETAATRSIFQFAVRNTSSINKVKDSPWI